MDKNPCEDAWTERKHWEQTVRGKSTHSQEQGIPMTDVCTIGSTKVKAKMSRERHSIGDAPLEVTEVVKMLKVLICVYV